MAIPLQPWKYSNWKEYEKDQDLALRNIFKNEINMLLLFFAKLGFIEGLTYLSMEKVVTLTTSLGDDLDRYNYFKISQELFIKANKFAFDESGNCKGQEI